MDTIREFRYGMSRAGLVLLALLLLIIGLLAIRYVLTDLGASDPEALMGLVFIALVLGGILIPVPALEIIWWARGRVAVDTDGLRWRGWGAWNRRAWGDILAVGMPAPDAGRGDDERVHVGTGEDYQFIHGFGLRDREALAEAIRGWGGLSEVQALGRYTVFCRPGSGEQVVELAKAEIEPMPDALDFWTTRFRRF